MSSPDQFSPAPSVPPPPVVVPPVRIRTKRVLKRIAPLSAGTMLALLYGVMGLIVLPFILLAVTLGAHAPGPQAAAFAGFGAVMALCAPVMYAAMGFLTGVIGAALYNFFVRWTGGIEGEVE